MLYKFKSPAAGDLIMLEPNGRRVLEIIGKDAGPTGIILPEQMAAAQVAIQQAVEREEAQQQTAVQEAKAQGKPVPTFEALSLRKRAWPMLEMLQRCAKANAPITWGV
ncbi:MAG: DUF1840 domain-containing protein [Burkholderiaceae bacterium]